MRNVSALTAAAVLVIAAGNVSAHRLDELLQASRIAIADERVDVELDLTPGVAVAGAMLGDIDVNHDGTISDAEQRTFVAQVLASVRLAVDGKPLSLSLTSFRFPAIAAWREGTGMIAIRATSPLTSPPGSHTLRLRNEYRVSSSAFLANALVPESSRIAVNAQHRDGLQSDMAIDYSVTNRSWPHPALQYMSVTALITFLGAVARRNSSR